MSRTALPTTLKQILNQLADGQFHSGTDLAKSLNISRAAICKQLHALDELGLELIAVSGKGYRLTQPLELLSAPQIRALLSAESRYLLNSLEIYDTIPSTNQHLVELARLCDVSAIACFAEQQTAGRGRRGRNWVSPFGHNIYLSLLWHYQQSPTMLSGLSLAVGVAAIRALNALGIQAVGLKWPNDIYWQQRKLGGILIELSGEDGGPCRAVVGLGLNLYVPPAQAEAINQDWTDLHTVLGGQIAGLRNRLAAALLNELIPLLAHFERDSLSHYLAEWREYDVMLGKQAVVSVGTKQRDGEVIGIDDNGLLLLKTADDNIQRFASGEVSLRGV